MSAVDSFAAEGLTGHSFDELIRNGGFNLLCGVDEAGRGPLAGPVYAAAVILDPDNPIEGLNDSKKLSEKKRELLFDEICEKAAAYSITSASVEEIETINILAATMLAMKKAVEALDVSPDFVLVDGNKYPDLKHEGRALIKGDVLSASVSAASILAKVSRDRYITEIAEKYPEYLFEKHKGYGTALHRDRILEHGPCEIHRMSFLKKILKK